MSFINLAITIKIIAWVVTGVLGGAFMVWWVPIFPLPFGIVLGILFGVLFLISVVSGFFASWIDAADQSVQISHIPLPFTKSSNKPHVIDSNFYCNICEVHV
jgi:hypothetical protein